MEKDAESLAVPRYKELSVINLWSYVKDLPEFCKYFPDYQESEYPERDFLIAVISKVYPDALEQLIEDARESRAVNNIEETANLIELTPSIKEAILSSHPQKSKWSVINSIASALATRGIANYLLKVKAKLRRPRRAVKERKARLDLLTKPDDPHHETEEQAISHIHSESKDCNQDEEIKDNDIY